MDLREMAGALDAKVLGPEAIFSGVSTDTRLIQGGDLFVAIEGPNYDGHAFLGEARNKRAAAALVHRPVASELPRVQVEDTRLALGSLAAYWRQKFDCPVIAVTGSNGKTTVKEMIGSILELEGSVLVSGGNLNNDIGLPLVLCRLRQEHRVAVLEMGMNHTGEIDYLTRIARPQVAVITNAAAAHLEGLGSVEAVAEAKAEIFNGLKTDGVAVVNADDHFSSLWRRRVRDFRCITFGIEQPATITIDRLEISETGSEFSLYTPIGTCEVSLPLPGRHNILNALAATAAAISVGVKLSQIKAGLEMIDPVSGRLQLRPGHRGAAVIDDTYNANPRSVAAALEVLESSPGTKIFVLGDMKELGSRSEEMHAEVGTQAKQAGIDYLLAHGALSRYAAEAFGNGARHFEDKAGLIEVLNQELDANTTVLVKGSRGMKMEEVVAAIAGDKVKH
jgi:UDP-N-acetylmuramoyl-tripeptide--D-alanyl-D-alanine ligase